MFFVSLWIMVHYKVKGFTEVLCVLCVAVDNGSLQVTEFTEVLCVLCVAVDNGSLQSQRVYRGSLYSLCRCG